MAQTVTLTLHSIDGRFVAFNIDSELYIMQFEPFPRIYNSDLKPQIIPNLDFWFQAQTHQRYGLQHFLDIVSAFRTGLDKSYSVNDLRAVACRAAITTKFAMLERIGEYSRQFWIELLDPVKLESVWVPKIRKQFAELRTKLGDDGFHNYLCRLWKFASKHCPGMRLVLERLIGRLERAPIDPVLPSTPKLDAELCHAAVAALDKELPTYRAVPPYVQERLNVINGRQA